MTVKLPTVRLKIVAQRIGVGLSTAVAVAMKEPAMLHTLSGRLTVAAVALIAAYPTAPGNAGIFRPATPGQLSLAEKIQQAVQTLLDTPAALRQRKAEAMAEQAFQSVLTDPQKMERLTQELQRAHLWQPGQPVPAGAQDSSAAEAAVAAPAAQPLTSTDPAITATGGNQ